MKEAFDLIKERLEEKKKQAHDIHGQQNINDCLLGWESAMAVALYIVSEVEAEYRNGETNADRIRAMSDEELAEFLAETELHGSQGSYKDYLDWLKSPTTD